MSTEEKRKKAPETAVWYFVGATFAFALGPMLFSDGGPDRWQTVLSMILGAGLFISGCVVFAKERRLRREAQSKPVEDSDAPSGP
ncbi:hypothetical protein [Nesterenkonia muleiensis]|uniref:hypothetical protein n=1 Tax=Nesterenkonia muleiensis TaxID=2282648 RepID=UPI000E734209|nr:hypothetical protein [Nesterenkonia muleiensis]